MPSVKSDTAFGESRCAEVGVGVGGGMFKLYAGAATETGQRNQEGGQPPAAFVSPESPAQDGSQPRGKMLLCRVGQSPAGSISLLS